MKFEIDWPRVEAPNDHIWMIGCLTGLSDQEIIDVVSARESWNGQEYVRSFRNLGFNCNPRFVKFDPATKYPCIMRSTSEYKGYWNAWVYNNGMVYGSWFRMTLDKWKENYPKLKITSMLQVWI